VHCFCCPRSKTGTAPLTYDEVQHRPSQLCGKRNHRLIAKIAIVWLPVASVWRSMSPPGRNRKETEMAAFLQIGVLLAMAAVAGVLIMGIVSMARGKDARKQNKLMQMRVLLQGLALLLLFILSLMAVGS
jgi:hypothetical protein